MNVSEASVLTTSLNSEVAIIPKGARTIDITNTGVNSVKFTGNSPQGLLNLVPVSISVLNSYSFGDIGKPYPEIIIDCVGSSADIVAVY
jgi:hypothetical protein